MNFWGLEEIWKNLVLKIHEIHHYLQILVLFRASQLDSFTFLKKSQKGISKVSRAIEAYFGQGFAVLFIKISKSPCPAE